MAAVFISYSRKDEIFARLLATDLLRMGATIWIDVEDIYPSQNWAQAIDTGLETCVVMLVIISPDSMASEQVRREWRAFAALGKPIIPILWRQTELPPELSQIAYTDFEHQLYQAARHQLRGSLERLGIHLGSEFRHRLGKRDDFIRISEMIATADNLSILSVSSISLAVNHEQLLIDKVTAGCQIRLILLNPNNETALKNWAILSNRPYEQTPTHLKDVLDLTKRLNRIPNATGNMCIRFLDFHFPFNVFGVNIHDETGVMLVGYYAYDAAGGDSRPHLMLNRPNNPQWFEFYTRQFETAWKLATPWEENPESCSD